MSRLQNRFAELKTENRAALVTFLVTASGLSLLGVGAAFWGLVAGVIVRVVLRPRQAT